VQEAHPYCASIASPAQRCGTYREMWTVTAGSLVLARCPIPLHAVHTDDAACHGAHSGGAAHTDYGEGALSGGGGGRGGVHTVLRKVLIKLIR
jgi:hypothetical protein